MGSLYGEPSPVGLENQSVADPDYWNGVNQPVVLQPIAQDDLIREWLGSFFSPVQKEKSCFEVGCFPGGYLSIFGEWGYTLNGVDQTRRLPDLEQEFKKRGHRVGQLWNEDFLNFECPDQFDVVISLGFIEHFKNWEDVLRKHLELVKPGGTLVLETPNFLGSFQYWLHKTYDASNLEKHVTAAMDVGLWVKLLKKEGFEIIYDGYFKEFDFYTVDEKKGFKKLSYRLLKNVIRPIGRYTLAKNKKAYSPFAGCVARKKAE